jgi:hypothetical protein
LLPVVADRRLRSRALTQTGLGGGLVLSRTDGRPNAFLLAGSAVSYGLLLLLVELPLELLDLLLQLSLL